MTPRFILDSSVALAWCLPDERDTYSVAVIDSLVKIDALVPSLWPLEVANTLTVSVRRGRCTSADVDLWLIDLAKLPIVVDTETADRAWGGNPILCENSWTEFL